MKGYVTKLCDVDSIQFPAELLQTHVDTQLIEKEINALSLRYAKQSAADCAAQGNIVRCKADEAGYPDGRPILLFTGAGLPGAEAAVQAALGKAVGDTFAARLMGKPVSLTVEKIIRRTPVAVDDALIASLGIDGVSTVEGYRAYLTEKALADAKLEQSKMAMHYLMDEMIGRSEYEYDQAEMAEQIEKDKAEYAAMPEEDSFAPPSQEELAQSVVYQCKQGWVAEAFCKSAGIEAGEEEIRQRAEQMSQMMQLMGENVPGEDELLDMARTEACLDPLFEHLNDIILQKIGG